MEDDLCPRQADETVFITCFRYDRFRIVAIRHLLLGVSILFLLSGLGLGLFSCYSFPPYMFQQHRSLTIFFLLFVFATGIIPALMFLLLRKVLMRKFFGTVIRCTPGGINYRSGAREIECSWGAAEWGRIWETGRIQNASLMIPNGRIFFDGTWVNANAPIPRQRVRYGREFLIYPNGTEKPIAIRQNELFMHISRYVPHRS